MRRKLTKNHFHAEAQSSPRERALLWELSASAWNLPHGYLSRRSYLLRRGEIACYLVMTRDEVILQPKEFIEGADRAYFNIER